MTRKLASVVSQAVSLVAVVSSFALAVLSAIGYLSVSAQLSTTLAILSVLLLTLVTDRFLVLAELRSSVDRVYHAVNFPLELKKLAEATPFDAFVSGSSDLLVVGLTKVSTLAEGTERITRLIRSGCRVRVAVLDDSTPELYELTARSTTHTTRRLLGDFQQFVETLRTVRAGLTQHENTLLMVRTYSGLPTAGVVLAYRGKSSVTGQVYFYPYRTDPHERPCIELRTESTDEWLKFFRDQYEKLWEDILNTSTDPTI